MPWTDVLTRRGEFVGRLLPSLLRLRWSSNYHHKPSVAFFGVQTFIPPPWTWMRPGLAVTSISSSSSSDSSARARRTAHRRPEPAPTRNIIKKTSRSARNEHTARVSTVDSVRVVVTCKILFVSPGLTVGNPPRTRSLCGGIQRTSAACYGTQLIRDAATAVVNLGDRHVSSPRRPRTQA